MLLWQAIALAGGLSMIGAMLVYGLEPVGDNLIAGPARPGRHGAPGRQPTTATGLLAPFASRAAALLTVHLVFTLLLTYYKIQRQRRRHRELLALLASPSADGPRTLVINHDSPVAYCLPGGARLGHGALRRTDGEPLEPDELRAVLIHENAHLNQRHHLLLWAFAAWRQALPWLPTTQPGTGSGELPDRDARRRRRPQDSESKATLIKAIAIVASGSAAAAGGRGRRRTGGRRRPPGAAGAAGTGTALRTASPAQPASLTPSRASGRAAGLRSAVLLGCGHRPADRCPACWLAGSAGPSRGLRRRCVPGPGWRPRQ